MAQTTLRGGAVYNQQLPPSNGLGADTFSGGGSGGNTTYPSGPQTFQPNDRPCSSPYGCGRGGPNYQSGTGRDVYCQDSPGMPQRGPYSHTGTNTPCGLGGGHVVYQPPQQAPAQNADNRYAQGFVDGVGACLVGLITSPYYLLQSAQQATQRVGTAAGYFWEIGIALQRGDVNGAKTIMNLKTEDDRQGFDTFVKSLPRQVSLDPNQPGMSNREIGANQGALLCRFVLIPGIFAAASRIPGGQKPSQTGTGTQQTSSPIGAGPGAPMAVRVAAVRESAGAQVQRGKIFIEPATGKPIINPETGLPLRISARSRVTASFATAIQSDVGEAEAYKAAVFKRGELGLQRPAGANVKGGDFFTAARDANGDIELIVTDVKTSLKGTFPTPKTTIPGSWKDELSDAISPQRLKTGDPAIEAEIQQAYASNRIRLRQLNADYSTGGQGTITGW
nr:hypothetical protein [uncultured Rhodopila sp.]